MKEKKEKNGKDGFFVSAFSISLIALIAVINVALVFGPAALWFFTGKWPWALLYFITVPLALAVPAGIEKANKNK